MFGFVQQRQWNMGTDQEGIYWTSSMLRTCFFSFFFSSIMFPRVHLLGNIQYPLREKYEEEKEEGGDRTLDNQPKVSEQHTQKRR